MIQVCCVGGLHGIMAGHRNSWWEWIKGPLPPIPPHVEDLSPSLCGGYPSVARVVEGRGREIMRRDDPMMATLRFSDLMRSHTSPHDVLFNFSRLYSPAQPQVDYEMEVIMGPVRKPRVVCLKSSVMQREWRSVEQMKGSMDAYLTSDDIYHSMNEPFYSPYPIRHHHSHSRHSRRAPTRPRALTASQSTHRL